ncbi:UNVERIFIED_CONTAM: hypothetical protein FKN15_031896 [Acipenser sinensis]
MDRNALAELLQALESRRDAEERRREERYTALIERENKNQALNYKLDWSLSFYTTPLVILSHVVSSWDDGPNHFLSDPGGFGQPEGGRGTEKGGAVHGSH